MIRKFTTILLDIFVPEISATTVFQGEQKKVKPVKVARPDNYEFHYGKVFGRQDTQKGFEIELYDDKTNDRTAVVTTRDVDVMNERNKKSKELKRNGKSVIILTDAKYKELKPFWADGLSAAEIANKMSHKKGYSRRIVEAYVAAFNEAS